MSDVLLRIIELVFTTAIAGFSGYFFAKRKYNAEATGSEIENGTNVVKMYKEALEDLPPRYEARFKVLEELFTQKENIFKQEIELLKKERDFWKKRSLAFEKVVKQQS